VKPSYEANIMLLDTADVS